MTKAAYKTTCKISLSLSLSLSLFSVLPWRNIMWFPNRAEGYRPNELRIGPYTVQSFNVSLHATTSILLKTLNLYSSTTLLGVSLSYFLFSCHFYIHFIIFAQVINVLLIHRELFYFVFELRWWVMLFRYEYKLWVIDTKSHYSIPQQQTMSLLKIIFLLFCFFFCFALWI